jgi:alcohol dehydrogenase class IV
MINIDSDKLTGLIQFIPSVERILYGASTINEYLKSEVERLNAHRILLLAPRSLKDRSIFQQVLAILGKWLATSFTAAFEHVPLDAVIEAVAAARRCEADLVVAIGGGSIIDAAKAVRTCLGADLNTAEQLGSFMERREPLPTMLIPQLSIPTTLSGSEYTRSFSATDFKARIKRSYTESALASRVIIYDPAVTLDTPLSLWLSSGIMAIDHAVEVLCSSAAHFLGDAMKLSALQELITYLPRTIHAGDDLRNRLRCQIGAWLADHSPVRTQPLKPRVTVLPSHALAYEFAALCRLPYGLTACLTLPACMRWTAARDPTVLTRQAEVARALKIVPSDASEGMASKELVAKLQSLIQELGLPTRFRDVHIDRGHLQIVANHFAARGASLITGEAATETQVISLLEDVL